MDQPTHVANGSVATVVLDDHALEPPALGGPTAVGHPRAESPRRPRKKRLFRSARRSATHAESGESLAATGVRVLQGSITTTVRAIHEAAVSHSVA